MVDNVEVQSLPRGWVGWINYDQDVLSISTEIDSPISGNGSLKVDVTPATSTAETNSSWSIVSTDFIPIKEGQSYNYSLQVSAKDVNQLHSKVIYYDSNKNEINSDFIFGGRDGTFEDKFSNSFLAPNGTKYVQIQLWIRPTLEKSAKYMVDNVEVQSLPRGWVGWINYGQDVLSISTEIDSPISGNGSLKVDVKPALSTTETNSSWSRVSTDFIPIMEITPYGLSLEVSAKNVNQLHSKVIYYDSNKNEINSDLIFSGRDGTFEDKFSNSFLAPNGTKYVQIQLWIRPTLEKSAKYMVDNVEVQSLPRGWVGWINYDQDVLSISTEIDSPISGNGSLKVGVTPAVSTTETPSSWSWVSSDFIPILEITAYGVSLEVSAKNVNHLTPKVIYCGSI